MERCRLVFDVPQQRMAVIAEAIVWRLHKTSLFFRIRVGSTANRDFAAPDALETWQSIACLIGHVVCPVVAHPV